MAYVPLIRGRDGSRRIAGPIRKERGDFSALRPDARVIWCFNHELVIAPGSDGGYRTRWSEEEVMEHFDWAPTIHSMIAARREAHGALETAPVDAA